METANKSTITVTPLRAAGRGSDAFCLQNPNRCDFNHCQIRSIRFLIVLPILDLLSGAFIELSSIYCLNPFHTELSNKLFIKHDKANKVKCIKAKAIVAIPCRFSFALLLKLMIFLTSMHLSFTFIATVTSLLIPMKQWEDLTAELATTKGMIKIALATLKERIDAETNDASDEKQQA